LSPDETVLTRVHLTASKEQLPAGIIKRATVVCACQLAL